MSVLPSQRTSLYVGDIPQDLPNPEDSLHHLFNSVAPVVSLKVCRDLSTQKSLGYAYVNFQNSADADKALDALNFTEIVPGHQIRVMIAIRDPILRKNGTNNLFVKKLDPAINAKALQEAFSEFGRLLSTKVALDSDGKSKGYGFVQFDSADAAKAAMKMDGKKIGAFEVTVAQFVRRSERDAQAERTFTNIYAKNISSDLSDEEVKEVFESFGVIATFFVSGHPQHPTKFAIVTYAAHESAVQAIEKLNGSTESKLCSSEVTLTVCRALKRSERMRAKKKLPTLYQSQGRNLYVKHLGEDVTQTQLEELFSPFGKISSCALMKDQSGIFRGFAFVCFESREDAMNAMRELGGKTLTNGKRPLYVSQAEQKDMRSRLLQQRRTVMRQQPCMGPPMGMYNQPWTRPFPMNPMGYGNMSSMPPFVPAPMMRRQIPPMMQQQRSPMMLQNHFTQPPPPTVHHNQRRPGSIDPNQLAQLSPEECKNVLGETLYTRIVEINPQQAAKITGMLLEMGTTEILEVLEDSAALHAKVNEAISVLQQHSTQ